MNTMNAKTIEINTDTDISIQSSLNSDILNIKLETKKTGSYIDEIEKLYINVNKEHMQDFIDGLQNAFENSKK